ncbi:MAG: peptidylprolyl isomerase [Myxococcota bacterium]|nr:peptidylprolyl isomerase [Myxococcota bacterium]
MLDVLRRSQRWLMGALILLIGGVFVFYLGVGAPVRGTSGAAVVEIGSRRYTLMDLQRVRERQEQNLRETLGDAFDRSVAGAYLDQAAADQLIQRAVLSTEAERLGLRAGDEEVRRYVRSLPGFESARADDIRSYAESQFGSERRFVEEARDDLLFTKLRRLIDATVAVSDAEAREAIRHAREEVQFAFVSLDTGLAPDGYAVDPAEVERLLAEQPERARSFFDENPDRFRQPERVRARHVLVRLAPDATEADVEAAREKAQGALDRIRAGEDFAAVAEELSDDPGSKTRGGDLGLFPRGQMTPPFEEAAFALQPGELSDLVRTDFGFHVIRVEERAEAEERTFDDAAREIAEELVTKDAASAAARETVDRLAQAVRDGRTLTDAAREEGLTLERTDWVRRRAGGFVAGLGTAPDVLLAVFAMTENGSLDRPFEVGDKLVLVERLDWRGPSPEEIASALEGERERLLSGRRNQALSAWYRNARQRFTDDGSLLVDLSALSS